VSKSDQLSLLDFKSTVAACLCKQNKDGQRKRGRPSSSIETAIQLKKKIGSAAPMPEKEVRKDGMGHWPQFSEKRERCKKPGCNGAPKVFCIKCTSNVHLCFTPNSNCFFFIFIPNSSYQKLKKTEKR
jgi:hypothetical protein